MPLSADTSFQDINCSPGKTYFITADDGSVTVQSIVNDLSEGDVIKSEGTVESGKRLRYEGGANKLRITPSASGVFYTVTEAK